MFLVDGASIQPTHNQNFGNVDDPEITEGIAELNREPELTEDVVERWRRPEPQGVSSRLRERPLQLLLEMTTYRR